MLPVDFGDLQFGQDVFNVLCSETLRLLPDEGDMFNVCGSAKPSGFCESVCAEP